MVPYIAPSDAVLASVADRLDVRLKGTIVTPTPKPELFAHADITPRVVKPSRGLQCVPFARERSGVAIRGNANTWWRQAAGRFVRVNRPEVGAVVVMNTRRGHVGVVTKVVNDRTIIIDHSNWLSNGRIYLDQPVIDVSANNDWSQVRVWHPGLGQYGRRVLGVPGFILNEPANGDSRVYASWTGPRVNTTMVAMVDRPRGEAQYQLTALRQQDVAPAVAAEPDPGEIVDAPIVVASAEAVAPTPQPVPAAAVAPAPQPVVAAPQPAPVQVAAAAPQPEARPEPAPAEPAVVQVAVRYDAKAPIPRGKPQTVASLARKSVPVVAVAETPRAKPVKAEAAVATPQAKPKVLEAGLRPSVTTEDAVVPAAKPKLVTRGLR